MCAINPVHKKRFVFDVYTANPKLTKEDFETLALEHLLQAEEQANAIGVLRFHLKESNQEAD
jgi:hypothetical protein